MEEKLSICFRIRSIFLKRNPINNTDLYRPCSSFQPFLLSKGDQDHKQGPGRKNTFTHRIEFFKDHPLNLLQFFPLYFNFMDTTQRLTHVTRTQQRKTIKNSQTEEEEDHHNQNQTKKKGGEEEDEEERVSE